MKWILLASFLFSLSLLVVGRAIPAKRRAGHHSSQVNNGGRNELADIILNEEQKQLLKEAENYNGKRAVIADLSDISDLYSKPWTNGIIPYVMDPKIAGTQYETSYIKAMRIWQNYTCIKFVNRTNEDSYVILTNHTSGCHSGVGMWNKTPYEVYLSEHCNTPGNAMHELGHVIGFRHEHQRYDRDDYIKVIEDNLDGSEAATKSFSKIPSVLLNDFGVGYDYASVMHYGKDAFAKRRNRDVFEVNKDLPKCLRDAGLDVGQRITISSKDIEQANKLYKCPEMPIPSLCELLLPSQEEDTTIRKKNIKTENKISLGLDDGTWVTCRPGRCFKKSCDAGFDETKRSIGSLERSCTDHQLTIRTTITRDKSDKVKVGDTVTLEGKPGQFLDCTSEGGFCSMTQCVRPNEEGSNGVEECSNHVFHITSEGKKTGDIVQTHDMVQLEYKHNGQLLDCTGMKCLVRPCNEESKTEGQTKCKPPSFIIQK
ncbi:high choriolytic enzyme 1-like [Dysidea avara]|uniref:high choriolytic enzyme 1-like n=1 Tax=Dysidea avara TaxID=196820 RepID=UPI003331BAFC